MGVPAHDQRDFEFARKYDLPIKVVVAPPDWDGGELAEAYVDEGAQVSSGQFDGLPSADGKERSPTSSSLKVGARGPCSTVCATG